MTPRLPALAGWCIAVTADRRAEEQVALLERRGAEVRLAPTIRTVPLVDSDQLAGAIDEVIGRPPDVLVLLTGIGTRGMFAAAESTGRDVDLAEALGRSRILARGPKAAGAATTIGLDVSWQAPGERASEIRDQLRREGVAGARVAVQRDGQRTPWLADELRAIGAEVVDIPVYRWELPEDRRPAVQLVDAIVAGEIDAVTFTSSPALVHLVSIAEEEGRGTALLDALRSSVLVACVGPVCADTAEALGIPVGVVPRRARMGTMVQAIAAHFEQRGRSIAVGPSRLALRGRAVFVDDVHARLGARERAVLELLVDASGAVVPKQRLLRDVWGPVGADEHAVEVAVARLRRGLGPAGAAVQTVPRRGYRLVS